MVSARRSSGQALVELALVMPVLVGVIAVLFQFGLLFMSYLAVVHTTRDVGRWLAVHPDTLDTTALAHARSNAPSSIDPNLLSITFSPACTTLTSGKCASPSRAAGDPLLLTVTYDASSSFFLPTDFRLGPYLRVAIPTSLPGYSYQVMVEPH